MFTCLKRCVTFPIALLFLVAAGLSGCAAHAQSVALQAGFMPDPYTSTLSAGGGVHFDAMGGCPGGGWVADPPSFDLQYTAGQYPLSIYVRSQGDTLLYIRGPGSEEYCNDDSDGLDPVVRLGTPNSGRYTIWVGTYSQSPVPSATLYISER